MLREGLRALINSQEDMEIVGEADNGRAAISIARQLRPDVVVMDVSMPRMNGVEATKQLKQLCPEINILTLTRHADKGYVQQLLQAGASGYVVKQSASSELVRGIRAVAAGETYLDEAVTPEVVRALTGPKKTAAGSAGALSLREEDVLRLTALGHSNKEIGAQLGISVKTVEAHKANAMDRLGMSSRIDIVRYAMLRNWLQEN